MPRKPRVYLPGIPTHVIQRGNDRGACFFAEDDYRYYLQALDEARQKHGIAVHAYVLMTNHVHLLMTPNTHDGISRLMQSLGRRYVQYINTTYRRSGTLWEGRHKASLVQAEDYLLTCYRYIEMNPVRARMVAHPGDYPWSSYRHHAYGEADRCIQDHDLYYQLDSHPERRRSCYRELFLTDLDKDRLHAIRNAVNFSMPLGNDRFREEIERKLGRSLGQPKRGRPAKHTQNEHRSQYN
jgi:putative transposase